MAVIHPRSIYKPFEDLDSPNEPFYQTQEKGEGIKLSLKLTLDQNVGLDCLDLSPPGHGMCVVELRDSRQVPEYSNDYQSMTTVLDTPSIIESFADPDHDPFRFQPGCILPESVLGQPADIVSAATASVMLGIPDDENETFQDLSSMIGQNAAGIMRSDVEMPMSCSSPPLLSPTGSTYSVSSVTSVSSNSILLSGASTSNDPHFFAPDLEVLTSSDVKSESSSSLVMRGSRTLNPDIRYNEMRRKNNLASRRSRLTRREKEKDLEQQQQTLKDENEALRVKLVQLEELVDKVKKIILQTVSNRSLERK